MLSNERCVSMVKRVIFHWDKWAIARKNNLTDYSLLVFCTSLSCFHSTVNEIRDNRKKKRFRRFTARTQCFFSVWWGYCTLQSKTSYQSVALTQRQTVFEGRCVSDLIAADSKDASRLAERHEIIDQIWLSSYIPCNAYRTVLLFHLNKMCLPPPHRLRKSAKL